jgi:hypothetical protein
MTGRISVLLVVLALGPGCGLKVQQHYVKMRPHLVSGDFEAANTYLDESKKRFYRSEKNRLLFYMDKAMILHLAGRFEESNDFLERAKTAADELWTESVGEHVSAVLTSDNALSYEGEDFERVLLHVLGALNYIELGQFDSARVEARQVTNKLELYNGRYDPGAKNHYSDDAFARWLAGKLSETERDQSALNSAWIDYKKSLLVYRNDYAHRYGTSTPRVVVRDALRVLDGLGADFADEFAQVRRDYPGVQFLKEADRRGRGEVILLHLSGEAPFKVDEFWEAEAGGDYIRVAYPRFVAKSSSIVGARLVIEELDLSADTELFEDVTRIAIENLEDHIGRIRAKAIARAIAKYIASKGVDAVGTRLAEEGESGGQALQILAGLMEIASIVSEEADKRSWITLPGAIGVGRVFLAPGDYTARVEFLDRSGFVVDSTSRSLSVEAGKTTFLSERTFR